MKKIKELFTYKKFVIFDKNKGEELLKVDNLFPQHFYPNSIVDYANSIKRIIKGDYKNYPIISLSVKDYPFCNFACKDCLVVESRTWARKNIDNLVLSSKKYKNILDDISNYSKENGVKNVRIEFCGEGNPDLYNDRKEIIKYAHQVCNMNVIYISTCSCLSLDDLNTLASNASFIRISFPGIDSSTYEKFSNQKNGKFSYCDALDVIKTLVNLRKKYGREDELLIGARACVREEFCDLYESFLNDLDKVGIDCVQLVKLIKYNACSLPVMSNNTNEKLKTLKKRKYKNIKQLQIPSTCSSSNDDRNLEKYKFKICFSALFNPILYGDHLITCTQTEKIINSKFHYGTFNGQNGETGYLLNSESTNEILKNIPLKCSDCCAVYDNILLNQIYEVLLENRNDIENLEFRMEV